MNSTRATTLTLALLFAVIGVAGTIASTKTNPLPNQPALPHASEGRPALDGWQPAAVSWPKAEVHITPENPAFAGAHSWLQHEVGSDPERAAITAFTSAGMRDIKVSARRPCSPDAVAVLDANPEASGVVVMVSGVVDGKASRGIALVLRGSSEGDTPGTASAHAFMAPQSVFEALGGYAIVAVRWLQASATPQSDMSEDGLLAPQAAVDRLSLFFTTWITDYVIPMMGMALQSQLQTIQNMQSWNNAMNACAGSSNCSVVPSSDGSGAWQAQTR